MDVPHTSVVSGRRRCWGHVDKFGPMNFYKKKEECKLYLQLDLSVPAILLTACVVLFRNLVEQDGHSITRQRHLLLQDGRGVLVVLAAQLLALNGLGALRKNCSSLAPTVQIA